MNNRSAALPENEIARPTPAVVIAVGRFAAEAARQTQRIYQRGDARRAAASVFYQFQPDDTTGLALVELSNTPGVEPKPTSGSFLEQRQAALRLAVEHGPALKARLESLLHEQRVHERLIAAGWEDYYDVPLNFFILADINDPWASGVLLPLGAVLNELMANTSLCQAHFMLSIAVFPESEADQNLAVYSFLHAFDDFMHPESEQREALARALNLQYRQAPDFAVYLFDNRKEGTAMVKDPASLNTLVGNALLALLQRDLARRFFQERDEDALFERASYYSSIGAAGLVYDPDALQTACARRIGHAFLTEKILCVARDGQAAIQVAHQLQEKLGKLPDWLESLSAQLPPAVGQVRIQPEPLEMVALLTDISLSPLDYERVNQTPWADQLLAYKTRFEQKILPEVNSSLGTNREQLETHLAAILRFGFERLPLEVELYPGGLQNARQVLEITAASFEKAVDELEKLAGRMQERQPVLLEKLTSKSQEMQGLLANAPALPWWVRILPVFARRWLVPLYLARHYGRQLYLAQALRDECLGLLQQYCGLLIELQALEQIRETLPGLQALVKEAQTSLGLFEEKLTQAVQSFSAEWEKFPLAAAENGWNDLFRQPVADQVLTNWAYAQWRP
ncbi:MAG: hypothetical protein WCK35_29500, partial [Chloroflexota bacterium]